jgi:hypothetical protein
MVLRKAVHWGSLTAGCLVVTMGIPKAANLELKTGDCWVVKMVSPMDAQTVGRWAHLKAALKADWWVCHWAAATALHLDFR